MAAALVANPAPEPLPPPSAAASSRPLTHPSTTGRDVRLAARANAVRTPTSGLAPRHLQANLVMLPARYAADFRLLCARNPVPCPLLAESPAPGRWDAVSSRLPIEVIDAAGGFDVRRDAPRYNVYEDGLLVESGAADVVGRWADDDHVAFLIGCSFSFEAALAAAGLPPRHAARGRNVPMYRTAVPLCPAGVFTGATYVVSMRPYRAAEVERVRAITRGYSDTHGEPIAWGWDALARLGIRDVDDPQWGDAPLTEGGRPLGELYGSDDEVPVFWGCGVTPQEAVMRAGIQGTVMAHAPGYMLLLDCTNEDVVSK
ncbi:hypothetical protein SLS62_005355 [Diatrype stigma]|uniref:Hydro-lyase n=1 Tax=Diatrype stigma TaxID=117547 RepID=A0AAN9YPQ5_9PEZI